MVNQLVTIFIIYSTRWIKIMNIKSSKNLLGLSNLLKDENFINQNFDNLHRLGLSLDISTPNNDHIIDIYNNLDSIKINNTISLFSIKYANYNFNTNTSHTHDDSDNDNNGSNNDSDDDASNEGTTTDTDSEIANTIINKNLFFSFF